MWFLVVFLAFGIFPVEPFSLFGFMNSKIVTPVVVPSLPVASSTLPPLSSLPPLTLPAINITLPPISNFTLLPPLVPVTTPSPIAPLIDPRVSLKLRDAETFGPDLLMDKPNNVDPNTSGFYFPKNKKKRSINSRNKRQANCGCFITSQCPANVTTTTTTSTTTPAPNNGAGLIDFRIVGGGGSICITGYTFCCVPPAAQISCGARLTTSNVYPTVSGQAKYGDYPWMVVILTTDNQYVGGGTLIDTQHILTTAHRISNYPNGIGLKIRLGEWDASGNYEQYPFKDYTITRVWTHESYNPNTLQNDISLIRLTGGIGAPVPSIIPVCMPAAGQLFEGLRCWVSGWGKDAFGTIGSFQTILKAIDVPVLAPGSCETTLRTTRLGTAFVLDRASFICAGGETNKDACTGDGGSGLVCEATPGKWILAGMVAWGIGCAGQGIPAAYVNVVNYLPWITAKQAST